MSCIAPIAPCRFRGASAAPPPIPQVVSGVCRPWRVATCSCAARCLRNSEAFRFLCKGAQGTPLPISIMSSGFWVRGPQALTHRINYAKLVACRSRVPRSSRHCGHCLLALSLGGVGRFPFLICAHAHLGPAQACLLKRSGAPPTLLRGAAPPLDVRPRRTSRR